MSTSQDSHPQGVLIAIFTLLVSQEYVELTRQGVLASTTSLFPCACSHCCSGTADLNLQASPSSALRAGVGKIQPKEGFCLAHSGLAVLPSPGTGLTQAMAHAAGSAIPKHVVGLGRQRPDCLPSSTGGSSFWLSQPPDMAPLPGHPGLCAPHPLPGAGPVQAGCLAGQLG